MNNWLSWIQADIAPVGPGQKIAFLATIPTWAVYLLATLFLLLSIGSFLSFIYVNKYIQRYKAWQLDQWCHRNKNLRHYSYKEAGLHLPILKIALWFLPIVLGVVFGIIAIAFYSNHSPQGGQ